MSKEIDKTVRRIDRFGDILDDFARDLKGVHEPNALVKYRIAKLKALKRLDMEVSDGR
jgi:hypothetical protein